MVDTSCREWVKPVLRKDIELSRDECSEKINWEENGMEVTVGELRAPTFYVINETKFWKQVQQLLKSQIQCFHITLVNFRQRTQALSRGLARGGFQGFRNPPLAPRNPLSYF